MTPICSLYVQICTYNIYGAYIYMPHLGQIKVHVEVIYVYSIGYSYAHMCRYLICLLYLIAGSDHLSHFSNNHT